jgi:hypothetical protein
MTTDAEMNTGSGLDFSRLDEFETAYLDTVDEDLKCTASGGAIEDRLAAVAKPDTMLGPGDRV